MTRFVIRRLLQAIPTFFGITILSYAIMVFAPGDPVSIMSFDPTVKAEQREALEKRLGVHDPLPMQYLRWLIGDDWMVVEELKWYLVELEDGTQGWLSERQAGIDPETGEFGIFSTRQPIRVEPNEKAETGGRITKRDSIDLIHEETQNVWGDNYGILRGDFGLSFRFRRNPIELIFSRMPATIELNIATIMVSLSIGVTLGILAAVWRGSLFDQSTRVVAVLGDAIPIFWLALMFILFFGVYLELLPLGSRCAAQRGECPPVFQRLEYLILPTAVLALGGISGWSRYMRAAMLETINSDYIRTARSQGLPGRKIWFKHGLRNALIPMATFLGPTFVGLLSGAVITETIFAWPGIGLLIVQAVSAQDYPVVMANVVISAVLTITAYLISDILYAMFDPRVRLS